MKKTALITLATIALSFAASASDLVVLESKTLNYGALAQGTNAPALEVVKFKRTAKTPERVTVKYKVNSVVEACVDAEIVATPVAEVTKTVCTANLDHTHSCEEVTFPGYDVLERKCVQKGLQLVTTEKEFRLDFNKAVKLTEGAEETFEFSVKQAKMNSTDTKLTARTLNTAAQYKIKAYTSKIRFKAKLR